MVVQILVLGNQSVTATFDTKQHLPAIVILSREARPMKEKHSNYELHDDALVCCLVKVQNYQRTYRFETLTYSFYNPNLSSCINLSIEFKKLNKENLKH